MSKQTTRRHPSLNSPADGPIARVVASAGLSDASTVEFAAIADAAEALVSGASDRRDTRGRSRPPAAHTERCDVRPYHGRACRRTLGIWQREEESRMWRVWPQSSMDRGCVVGSCAGVQPMRKSMARTRGPSVFETAAGRRRWPSRLMRRPTRCGRGLRNWARVVGVWYSWDRLDNGGRQSAQEVHPEWQDLAVGDRPKFSVPGGGLVDACNGSRCLNRIGSWDCTG